MWYFRSMQSWVMDCRISLDAATGSLWCTLARLRVRNGQLIGAVIAQQKGLMKFLLKFSTKLISMRIKTITESIIWQFILVSFIHQWQRHWISLGGTRVQFKSVWPAHWLTWVIDQWPMAQLCTKFGTCRCSTLQNGSETSNVRKLASIHRANTKLFLDYEIKSNLSLIKQNI